MTAPEEAEGRPQGEGGQTTRVDDLTAIVAGHVARGNGAPGLVDVTAVDGGSGVKAGLTPNRPRREVENQDFGAFVRRVLAAYARRAGAGDLDALGELDRLRHDLDGHLIDAVAALRSEAGGAFSWAEIGDALGITRQAAAQRFEGVGGARRPGGQPGRLRTFESRPRGGRR